jgi:hypothetical protein
MDDYPHILVFPFSWNIHHRKIADLLSQLGNFGSYLGQGSFRPVLEAFGKPELVVVHRPTAYIPARVEGALQTFQEQLRREWLEDAGENGDEYEKPEVRMLTTFQLATLLVRNIDCSS